MKTRDYKKMMAAKNQHRSMKRKQLFAHAAAGVLLTGAIVAPVVSVQVPAAHAEETENVDRKQSETAAEPFIKGTVDSSDELIEYPKAEEDTEDSWGDFEDVEIIETIGEIVGDNSGYTISGIANYDSIIEVRDLSGNVVGQGAAAAGVGHGYFEIAIGVI